MKRDAYGDDGPVQKRQRHAEEEVTFLIPSKAAGSIIGKSGTNISKLRSQQRARRSRKSQTAEPRASGESVGRSQNNPPAASYSVLTISASDVDTILDIIKDILPNLADVGQKGGDEDLDVRLLIHQSRAGCVIGRGGTKIKELREKTGARLKIFSNTAPQSTERVVQLMGRPECVADGIREVLDLTRQVPIKGPFQSYDPHNYDDYYSEEYGGFGNNSNGPGGRGGRAGSSGRGLGGGRGGHGPPMGPSRGSGGPRPMPMGRGPPPRSGMGDFGGPGSRSGGGEGRFGGPPRGGFGGGGFGGRDPRGNFNGGGGQETTTQVTIPTDLAGAIIGKGGSRIRKIRAESGARIEIAQPLPGSSDRIITIAGSPQRIQMAQYLLQQSVHESNHGRGDF